MSSVLASTLRRAATQPKPPAFRAPTMNMRRGLSTGAPRKEKTFVEIWCSDKGAWPVMAVIAGAIGFVSYWSISTLLTNPDVRLNRAKRGSVIRDSESSKSAAPQESSA